MVDFRRPGHKYTYNPTDDDSLNLWDTSNLLSVILSDFNDTVIYWIGLLAL